MIHPLDEIERRLQFLVENNLASLLPWVREDDHIASKLIDAMRSSLSQDTDGNYRVASNYVISVSEARFPEWESNPLLLNNLTEELEQIARDSGLALLEPVSIHLAIDPGLEFSDVDVRAILPDENVTDTDILPLPPAIDPESGSSTVDAYLIINGTQIFPINRAVINIGRQEDNHLVIDDPRVSRLHAQIRVTHGDFTIFDLDSTGGTYVNGERITRSILKPGDVIRLADIPIIFGRDMPINEHKENESTPVILPGERE